MLLRTKCNICFTVKLTSRIVNRNHLQLKLFLHAFSKHACAIENTRLWIAAVLASRILLFLQFRNFFDIMSKKGSALVKQTINKVETYFSLAELDDEDKLNFSMHQLHLAKNEFEEMVSDQKFLISTVDKLKSNIWKYNQ